MRRFHSTTAQAVRSDAGGVADQAALMAILLGGAVALGLVILGLLTDAGGELQRIVIPG